MKQPPEHEPVPILPDGFVDNPAAYLDEQQTRVVDALNRTYDGLKDAEAREPLPEDGVWLRINEEAPEYQMLLDSGITKEQIHEATYMRQELQDAGFAFINVLGGGEKGIMSGSVEDPDTGESIDLTDRKLLTKKELDAVYRHQQNHPEEFGFGGEDIDEVRKDMLSFLREAFAEPPYANPTQLALELQEHLRGMTTAGVHLGKSSEEWALLDEFLDERADQYSSENEEVQPYVAKLKALEELLTTKCADIYEFPDNEPMQFNIKQVRDVATHSLGFVRRGKIDGALSPFLDSGFFFAGNLDVNVHFEEQFNFHSNEQRRMNIATLHLAGGHKDYPGLSEMGGYGDQQYMTTGVFVDRVFAADPEERLQQQSREDMYLRQGQKRAIAANVLTRLSDIASDLMQGRKPPKPNLRRVADTIRSKLGR